jgi:hypothetical protein
MLRSKGLLFRWKAPYLRAENNFNSDVAKRWVFLPTTHVLPSHIKRKKCKKKKIIHLASQDRVTMQRKEERRREKKKEEGSRRKGWVLPEGSRP